MTPSPTIKLEVDRIDSNGKESTVHGSDNQHSKTLRSRYLAVKNLIFDEKDDICSTDSTKFTSIFTDLETLHQHVQKPREQIADAEALLNITSNLHTSIKATNRDGITLTDFVNSLLGNFAKPISGRYRRILMDWKKIGIEVPHVLRTRLGSCCTMIGPMEMQMKQRKARVSRKRARQVENSQPEEVDDTDTKKKKTNTDTNMSIMFEILRKHRNVRLEHLILNRNSFAQTVENIFTLSFLVKDGRAYIKVVQVDEKNIHLVSPKNAPTASEIALKEVIHNHFVFRIDFKDWKLMKNYVEVGQELMPERDLS